MQIFNSNKTGAAIVLVMGMMASSAYSQYDPNGPTPRLADGTPNLGTLEDGLGFWGRGPGPMVAGADYPPTEEIPFKPWSRALYDYRQETLAKDDPHVRCTPPGGPRQLAVPFGLSIVQVPHMNRVFILSGGSSRPWREIYMDGREHPDLDFYSPSYFGHSVGRWENDVLIVDTVGYNERFWMHREGYPHTEQLHLIERFSRPQMDTLRYQITIDDPSAYTEPWSTEWSKTWEPDQEIIEYFCQDNNIDQFHMMGNETLN
jgi:hypothetical protein